MKKAVILHGTQSSPEGNWFRWLAGKLDDKDIEVWLPELPQAEQPQLSQWLTFVRDECPFMIDAETILIGHSSGGLLALALPGFLQKKVGAVVGVSAFYKAANTYVATEWGPNADLFDVEPDWDFTRDKVKNRVLLHSDDDPYIPLDVVESLAREIDAEVIIIPSQGHFNLEKSPVYNQNEILLSILKERGLVSHEPILIVDEQDQPIGEASMQEAQAKGLWHRVVRCVVEDEKGRVLLQKRQSFLYTNPGKWDMTATGHVDPGESYEEAAARELQEEVGLRGIVLEEYECEAREFSKPGKIYRRHNKLFTAKVSSGVKVEPNLAEVSEVRWFMAAELVSMAENQPETLSEKLLDYIRKEYSK